jgi:4-amino-4-deoxy-L-arabinose transferase-like glycosyltransferase
MTSVLARPKLLVMSKPQRAALTGAVIATLVTIPGLGNGTLWDNSETAYGEVAREILLAHDWIVMHLNGIPWFVQPPLYFWIAAICIKIFGLGSFALRLPAALATIAMGGMTAYAITRQNGARAGTYAGVILSTCLMQAVVGRLAIMDALLDLAVAVNVFWWFRGIQTGRDRYFIYGAIAAALGFLTKGPVAPVVALIVIVPYYVWERSVSDARAPSWRGYAGALAVFVAIAAPWFVALMGRTGSGAVVELIGHYTVGRYTGTIENQRGPVWYYLPVIILGFFPWIAFFPSAIAAAIARMRITPANEYERRAQQMLRLALAWSVMPLLFFSFANTKLPNYIALELPALATLVSLYLDTALQRVRSRSALISTAAVPLFILVLAVAIVWFSRDNRLTGPFEQLAINLVYMGAAIFIGSLIAFVSIALNRGASVAPYALGGSMVVAVTFLAVLALPQAEQFKPVPHLAPIIQAQRRPGDAVAILHVSGGNALVFYTRPHVYVVVGPHDPNPGGLGVSPQAVICNASRTWLVAPRDGSTPTFGHSRRLMAQWGKANLYLYDGGACNKKRDAVVAAPRLFSN